MMIPILLKRRFFYDFMILILMIMIMVIIILVIHLYFYFYDAKASFKKRKEKGVIAAAGQKYVSYHRSSLQLSSCAAFIPRQPALLLLIKDLIQSSNIEYIN